MKSIFKSIFLSIFLLSPTIVFAQSSALDNLDKSAGSLRNGNTSPLPIIESIIVILLSFLGVICLIFFLYAGYLWLTAAGNDDQVGKAKTILRNTIIGTFIILSSYGLSRFVISQLSDATGSGDNGFGSRGPLSEQQEQLIQEQINGGFNSNTKSGQIPSAF